MFIQNLLNTTTPWRMPEPVKPNDPSWVTSWETASESAKVNLARGWLWCLTQDLKETSPVPLFQGFVNSFDDIYDWVQTIQPYLDSGFFAAHIADVEWLLLSSFLCGNDQQEPKDALELHNFFFGDLVTQKTALLGLADYNNPHFKYCIESVVKHAWEIAAEDHGELFQAARTISFYAGESCKKTPTRDLPKPAYLCQLFGYHVAHSTAKKPNNETPSREDLRNICQSEKPSIVAPLLREALNRHIYLVTSTGKLHLRTDSFLVDSLGTDDPYEVLKVWIPNRKEMLSHSEDIGLNIFEACSLIAAENELPLVATYNPGLPDTMTV